MQGKFPSYGGTACSVLFAAAAVLLALAPTPALAQCDSACVTRQNDAVRSDIERQQAEQRRLDEQGRMIAESQGYGAPQYVAPQPAPYAAVAFHPNASDVWVAAMYPDQGSAMFAARKRCAEVMGQGCGVTWQGTGYLGVARGADGEVLWAADKTKGAVQKRLDTQCAGFELGCTPLGMFKASDEFRRRPYRGENVRFPNDPQNLQKRFAAAAWIVGDTHDGKAWIAAGYATAKAAQDVALNLCRMKSKNDPACAIAVTTGNGVIAAYSHNQGNALIVEQSEARVRAAVAQRCKRDKLTCSIGQVYDARESAAFENTFR